MSRRDRVFARSICLLAPAWLLVPAVASADIVFEDTAANWRITMPSWAQLVPGASVVRDTGPGIAPDELVLEVFQVFKGAPDASGAMSSITLTFEEIDPAMPTLTKIRIADETAKNATTAEWADYHVVLVSPGQATFNKAATFPGDFGGDPGQDLYLDQFTQYSWTEDPGVSEMLNLSGGIVPVSDSFHPGSMQGQIAIDVDVSGDNPVIFFLKQQPTIQPVLPRLSVTGQAGNVSVTGGPSAAGQFAADGRQMLDETWEAAYDLLDDFVTIVVEYDEAALPFDEFALQIYWKDPVSGDWLVAGNPSNITKNPAAARRIDMGPTDVLGDWGIDRASNIVWANVDHTSQYGLAIPEPGTLGLLGLGAAGLIARRRRR